MACDGCNKPRVATAIPQPLRTVQTCILLGEPTGVLHDCQSCAGRVQIKEHACAIHRECTTAKPVTGVQCCATCADRKVLEPIARVRIPLDGHHFNCGLIEHNGKTILASRQDWHDASIWLHELVGVDEQRPRVTKSVRLNTGHPRSCKASEDPRLFVHRGKLHVAFTGYERRPGVEAANHLYASVDDHWQVEDVWEAAYAERKPWEKNWATFSTGDDLFAIYSHKPHTILRIDGRRATKLFVNDQRLPWSGGEIRGGASPVRVGDEFYHFFHGYLRRGGEIRWVYSVGLYTFEAKPPFRITRMCSEPVLMSEGRVREDADIIYPCGAIIRNGWWHISYGFQDQSCHIATLVAADVERVLRGIQ